MSENTGIDEESGGSGKVFLIMGLMGGIAIGGGLGYYFSSMQEPNDAEPTEHVEEQKSKEPLLSIPFEHVAVPIYAVRNDKRHFIGNYFIDIDVQVRGETNQIAIKRSVSQLTHGFISAISKSDLMQSSHSTELDLDKAAQILKKKATEIMGPDIIADVAITEAIRIPR